ncbi:MAG: metal-dependent transcriptional regulator, partial [Candidatus Omnitrophica bacterium]|nr:metal-dependent transcriptional regulator [Candidatus Omnitrophota bacterium]
MDAWILFSAGLLRFGALVWPSHGLLARWRRGRELAERSQREDVLKHLLKCEANGRQPALDSIAGALQIGRGEAAELLQDLQNRGLVSREGGVLVLNPAGREMALHITRAHRLWESYLAEQTGVAEDQWHERAESQEHLLTPQQTEALAAQLGHPTSDPHGDVIPDAHGNLAEEEGQPLDAVPANTPVLITHVEDEPETVYAQLCAQGLRPGMKAYVMEKSAQRIRFWADGTEHVLAPVLANNITVAPLPEIQTQDLVEEEFLSGLRPGGRARVLGLSRACRGAERRRLLDLGFVAGTPVEVEMVSPIGDPTAYRVRGTVIALRRERQSN